MHVTSRPMPGSERNTFWPLNCWYTSKKVSLQVNFCNLSTLLPCKQPVNASTISILACRAAGLAVAQRAAEWVGPSVPSLVKHVLDRIGQEEQQSNQEELAGKQHLYNIILNTVIRISCWLLGLLKALAVAAVAYNAAREGQQKDDNWLSKLLTEPLLRTAARYVAAGQLHDHKQNGSMLMSC